MSLWKVVALLSLLAGSALAAESDENLLIITVDTLRADRLSVYGYDRNQTPNIDRWAEEGVLFEHAFAEIPLTRPSHSSLLTGMLPFYHGVRDNGGFILSDQLTTLPEILSERGFETAGFISSYVLESRFGMAQGFDHFDDAVAVGQQTVISPASLRRSAPETTSEFLKWLEAKKESRFFVWLHYYDPHAPYPEGYDREVTRVDESIGRIDKTLKEWDLLDKTHILLLSDHGESLGEHGESAHGFFIYDSTLRIPWIYRPARGFSPKVTSVSTAYSLIDVMPTVLQLLGLQVPSDLQGKSAVRALLGRESQQHPLYAESYLPQIQFGWSPLRSIRSGEFKLIEAPRPELYNTSDDAGEFHNLFARQTALGSRYQQELQDLVSRYGPSDPSASTLPVDSETAQKLAALGYVALSPPKIDDAIEGTDPKDRIRLYEDYQDLLNLMHAPPPADVFQRIQRMRQEDPEVKGLHYLEAIAAERLGHLPHSQESYLKALEEDPENNMARANLGVVYVKMGKANEAEQVFRQVLAQDSRDYRSRNNLGMLLRMRGQQRESLSEFQKVTEEAPAYVPGWVNLGLGRAQAGDPAAAEKAFRKATTLDPENAIAHFQLARLLKALGREKEAQEELQTAIRLDPKLRGR